MRRPERRFYFFLAEKLGMPVGVMLRNMTSMEITEWMAFHSLQNAPDQTEEEPKKKSAQDFLREKFGHRVKKK